ncbi:hypothetical protein ACLOJK_010137 [Asimina triloba]
MLKLRNYIISFSPSKARARFKSHLRISQKNDTSSLSAMEKMVAELEGELKQGAESISGSRVPGPILNEV